MKQDKKDRILKNIYSQTFGRAISYLINFLSITIAARILGVESFGIFASLLATITIISKIVDFGVAPIVFRETARFRSNFIFINNAILLRVSLFFLTIVFFNLSVITLNYSGTELLLSNILLFNILFSSRFMFIRELLEILFKIDLRMHIVIVINLIDNLLLLVMILLMNKFNAGLEYVVWVYTLSNLPGFFLIIFSVTKGYSFKFSYDTSKIKYLLKESIPLFGYVFLLALFNQIDILIVNYFKSNFAAGIYSASVRLTMPLSIFPIAIVSTAMPYVFNKINSNHEKDFTLEVTIFKSLFLFSFLCFAILLFKSNEIVVLIFGNEFVEAALPTTILFASNVFLFVNYFSLDLLTAHNKQRINFYYAITIFITDILFLLVFLSSLSFIGASIAKLISTLFGFVILEVVFIKLNFRTRFLSSKVFLYITAILVVFYFLSYLDLVYYLVISLISFLFLTLKSNYFTNDEVELFLKLIKKENWIRIIKKL